MVDMTRMSFQTVETVENLQLQIISLSDRCKELERLKKENGELKKDYNELKTKNDSLEADLHKIKKILGI